MNKNANKTRDIVLFIFMCLFILLKGRDLEAKKGAAELTSNCNQMDKRTAKKEQKLNLRPGHELCRGAIK